MDESDRLSVTALSVSLVALIITVTQLLQQLLGTTDGHRRCRQEVIGAWSNCTRRKFIWYDLRFSLDVIEDEFRKLYIIALYSVRHGF